MSIGFVNLALHADLPTNQKLLLIAICSNIDNETMTALLLKKDMASIIGVTERQVKRLLKPLRNLGIIGTEQTRNGKNQGPNTYVVDWKKLESISSFRGTYGVISGGHPCPPDDASGGHPCPPYLIPPERITPNTNPPNPPTRESDSEFQPEFSAGPERTAGENQGGDLFELTPPPNNEPGNKPVVPESWIQAIFGDWQQILGHPRSALGPDKRKALEKAYPWGYTREQYRRAFLGNKRSTYHQGFNDGNKKYDSIGLICRSSENLDRFQEYADNPPKPELHNSTMDRASQRMAMEEWRRHCRDAVAEVEPDPGAAAEAAGGRVFDNSTGNVIHGNF